MKIIPYPVIDSSMICSLLIPFLTIIPMELLPKMNLLELKSKNYFLSIAGRFCVAGRSWLLHGRDFSWPQSTNGSICQIWGKVSRNFQLKEMNNYENINQIIDIIKNVALSFRKCDHFSTNLLELAKTALMGHYHCQGAIVSGHVLISWMHTS